MDHLIEDDGKAGSGGSRHPLRAAYSPLVLSVPFNHSKTGLDTVQVKGLGGGGGVLTAVNDSSGEGYCFLPSFTARNPTPYTFL